MAGAGYFSYDKWIKGTDLSVWSFVPNHSILVYESKTPLGSFQEILETDIWKNLSYIEEFSEVSKKLEVLDTLAGKGNFTAFFENTPVLISMNVTSSQDFDFLYIVEIQNLSQQTYLSKALAYFRDKGYVKKTRRYLNFTITEIINQQEKTAFTYIYHKNFFIGSFSAFLVEDAIRTTAEREMGFAARNPELGTLTKLEKDQGNLYLNINRLSSFINVFTKGHLDLNLAKSSFLDLKVGEDNINLSGFTFTDEPTHFLTNFLTTSGSAFDMAEIIPNETSWMYHITSTAPVKLGQSFTSYFQMASPKVLSKRSDLRKELDFDVAYTYNLLDQEIGIVTLESAVTGDHNKLLVLEIKDMGEALSFFNSVGERAAQMSGDSIYSEQYGDYEIRKLPAQEFPYALLGDIAIGFPQSYYLQYRNYLVFSNHLQQLKNFTFSIENENTWRKSLRMNRFLDQTNREASFSLFVNTPRAWNQIKSNLKGNWEEQVSESQFTYKNLEFLAFQFSTVDNKFYTNVTVYQPELPKSAIPESINTLQSITLPAEITTKPWLVTNHKTKEKDIFVQDSSNTIYLISSGFEAIWSKPLNEEINSEIQQLDYYKNGKLQYIFTTPSSVHIIDRTGEYIPGFPTGLPNNATIDHFSLIDYDNTKNYRYGIADTKGNVYLTDKNVKLLEGWNPKKFESPLAQAPVHQRINGKDVIIVLQQDGKLFLLSRRGGNYEGFPLDLKAEVADKCFIKNSNNIANSTITIISKAGEIIEISFTGKLIKREQLYKPGTSTVFSLMEDVTGSTYLILRQTENNYEVLDRDGNFLFEKNYFTKKPLYHQYYQLGGGSEFIVFIDPGGTYLYMYDQKGSLVTGRPLAASQPISIMKYENEIRIYRVADSNLELVSVSF